MFETPAESGASSSSSEDQPLDAKSPIGAEAKGKSRGKTRPLLFPFNPKEWGIPLEFQCSVHHTEPDWHAYRNVPGKVIFYYQFFKVGLRLPLDPFICELLDEINAVPCDLMLTTVRILMNFICVCRLLSFEPKLDLFHTLYILFIDKKSGRVATRGKSGELKLLRQPYRIDHWDSRVIAVESKKGWGFTAKSHKVALPSYGAIKRESKKMLQYMSAMLGFDSNPQRQLYYVDWGSMLTDECYLRLAGISVKHDLDDGPVMDKYQVDDTHKRRVVNKLKGMPVVLPPILRFIDNKINEQDIETVRGVLASRGSVVQTLEENVIAARKTEKVVVLDVNASAVGEKNGKKNLQSEVEVGVTNEGVEDDTHVESTEAPYVIKVETSPTRSVATEADVAGDNSIPVDIDNVIHSRLEGLGLASGQATEEPDSGKRAGSKSDGEGQKRKRLLSGVFGKKRKGSLSKKTKVAEEETRPEVAVETQIPFIDSEMRESGLNLSDDADVEQNDCSGDGLRLDGAEGSGRADGRPSWLKEGFKVPADKDDLVRIMDEIADVPPVKNIDLLARDDQVILGLGFLRRLAPRDNFYKLNQSTRDRVGAIGLGMAEMAENLCSVVDSHQNAINFALKVNAELVDENAKLAEEKKTLVEQVKNGTIFAKLQKDFVVWQTDVATLKGDLSKSRANTKKLEGALAASVGQVDVAAAEIKRLAKLNEEISVISDGRAKEITLMERQKADSEVALADYTRMKNEEIAKLEARLDEEVAKARIEAKAEGVAEGRARALTLEGLGENTDVLEMVEARGKMYFKSGVNHSLRMISTLNLPGADIDVLAHCGVTHIFDDEARAGHAVVPYSEEELGLLKDLDEEEKREHWVPPLALDVNVVSTVRHLRKLQKAEDGSEDE